MTDEVDIETLAGEYVLGTLDRAEREAVNKRRLTEANLDLAISKWEQRLLPLTEYVQDVQPSSELFSKIEKRIAEKSKFNKSEKTELENIVGLRKNLSSWRRAAIIGYALAACFAGIVLFPIAFEQTHNPKFFAIFQKEDQRPLFLLSINPGTRDLMVRPLSARFPAEKDYQLWIISDKLGPKPRSLGLLRKSMKATRKKLTEYKADILKSAKFGISLEPKGGSQTGQPTGPTLIGRLYETSL